MTDPYIDDKYVIFKREEFEKWQHEWKEWQASLPSGIGPSPQIGKALTDAVVIRLHDVLDLLRDVVNRDVADAYDRLREALVHIRTEFSRVGPDEDALPLETVFVHKLETHRQHCPCGAERRLHDHFKPVQFVGSE